MAIQPDKPRDGMGRQRHRAERSLAAREKELELLVQQCCLRHSAAERTEERGLTAYNKHYAL